MADDLVKFVMKSEVSLSYELFGAFPILAILDSNQIAALDGLELNLVSLDSWQVYADLISF